ncbi:MAG: alpha/beta fold hydrolase [Opitutales bacterium]
MRADPPILALHGAFGTPAFWEPVRRRLSVSLAERFDAVDVWALPPDGLPLYEPSSLLVGYSLGGRLALQLLAAAPDRFAGAVVIGAHPGLENPCERLQRAEADAEWAARFESMRWPPFWAAWSAQSIFQSSDGTAPPANGPPPPAPPPVAVRALREWSLGNQPNLWPRLPTLSLPVRWISGDKDHKFRALAKRAASQCPRGSLALAPGAGHRVPLEAPEWLAEQLEEFVAGLDVSQGQGQA